MVGIGMAIAVAVGEQHQNIGKQIRQGVQTIGHQGLRMREEPAQHLKKRQQQVDYYADPGASLCGGKTHRMRRLKSRFVSLATLRETVIFHLG